MPAVLGEVRDALRRSGLDPAIDPFAVRDVVDRVVGEHDPLDPHAAAQVWDAIAGYGPLQRLLDDPEVEELWVNSDDRVFVARRGRSELTTTVLAPGQIRDVVERMLRTSGRRLDVSQPFCDALLPCGSRLHVVIPDVTRQSWAVNVRKFVLPAATLDELVGMGTVPHGAARFLEAAVVAGLNIVCCGSTQAGKTTLLSCLLDAVPARERIVTCEEVFEVRCSAPDWVAMQTRQASLEGTGEIRLRRLVLEALRMRPDRLVVGEVRGEEALDLLIALTSGMPGMCTLHASSAREAITKLCTLPLLVGPNISSTFVVPTVASAVDLVVHVRKDASGKRRVTEIAAVPGRVEGDIVELESVYATIGGRLVPVGGRPPHEERFAAVGLDVASLLAAA
jgi:pilus assembly protein CpaF